MFDFKYKDKIPFFEELNIDEKTILKEGVCESQYLKGEVISTSSKQCTGLIFILSGKMRLFITSEKGAQITVYRAEDNDICVFSAACLIKNLEVDAYIEFEEDTKVLLVRKRAYQKLSDNSKFKGFIIDLVAERLSDIMWIFSQFVFSNTSERLADNLSERLKEDNVITVTHDELAKDLGTAREVVTRLLKQFQKDGVLELRRGKIEIKNIEKLMKI